VISLVINEDSYTVDPGVNAVAQAKIDYAETASERKDRFRPEATENVHPLTMTAGENYCQ
jgi:hypothetical protein